MIVKASSHRSRERLEAAVQVGDCFHSMRRDGDFYEISDSDAEKALAITGITRSRDKGDLLRCIPQSNKGGTA